MLRKELIDLINHYASLFVQQVKGQSAMGYNDINMHAEQTSIPILNAVFDLELKNANNVRKNYPAIDLFDEKKGVAFQITSTATPEKVATTLQKFIDNNLDKKYSTLFIYILTEKKAKYNTEKIRGIIKDRLEFDTAIHIIGYRDIMKRINSISSVEELSRLASLYEESSMSLLFQLQSLQKRIRHEVGKQLSFTDRVKNELESIIGSGNINKIPDLPELFHKLSTLENDLLNKEKELKEYREAWREYSENRPLQELLAKACTKAEGECNDIKQAIELEKEAVNALALNIRRQKEFLDQIDQRQSSERLQEAGRLFDSGEYEMVSMLLDYEGRQNYINKKLEERDQQFADLKSLANEEVLLALNILQRQDWQSYIPQISKHFEQSIQLGGYGVNSFQYSYFLEDIHQEEKAIDILHKSLTNLLDNETEYEADILMRLGKLQSGINKEKALESLIAAAAIYEHLFDKDRDCYEFKLANALLDCGTIYMHLSSLDQARSYLERALMIVGTLNKRADVNMQKLTYVILIALGSLHQQLGNENDLVSYLKMALYMGAVISLNNPEEELAALLKAVKRFRILIGEEKEGEYSEMIYNSALQDFLKIQKWQSQEEAFNTAIALKKLGFYLLPKQEITGAGVCFRGALKIFRALNRQGYSCLAAISDSLKWVGFIHMTRNEVKARKKVLLEALHVRKQLAENEPVENLIETASLLNELYDNSFIAVPASQYYKAYPYFEEALAIHKLLAEKYQRPHLKLWLQLLHHKSIYLSRGLDKTDAINWYRELIHLVSIIPSSLIENFEEDILMAINEAGQYCSKM